MSSIPLFIGRPLAPSMTKALTALNKDGFFTTYPVPFDPDLLRLMVAARPCAVIFSITNEPTYQQTFKLLDQFKRIQNAKASPLRDPALRMILLSEHWAVQLERWMEVGVHEFIPAPISQKALVYKLNRHYAKAVAAPLEGRVAPDSDVYTTSNEITLIKDPGETRGPLQAFYVPGETASQPEAYESLSIWVGSPEILGEDVEWKPASESSGFDETWVCVRTAQDKRENAPPTEALLFTGEKPRFDPETRRWLFRGEAPRLVRRRLDRHADDDVIIASSRAKVFIKDPESFDDLEVLKRSAEALRQVEQPVKVFLEGEFTEAETVAPTPPAPAAGEAKDVEQITEFLDRWEPKDADAPNARDARAKTSVEDEKEKPARRKTKASEDPLPGFYSGPGMREERTGYGKIVSKPDEPSSESQAPAKTAAAPAEAPADVEEQRKKKNAAPEDPSASREPARGDGPKENEGPAPRRSGDVETNSWRDLRSTRDKSGDDDDPRAKEKAIAAIIEKLKPTKETPQTKADQARKSADPEREADGPASESKRRSGDTQPARDQVHRMKADGPKGHDITGRLDGSDPLGTPNFVDRTEKPRQGASKIDGGEPQGDDVHRFAPDDPEGSDTWSMQNEGDDPAGPGSQGEPETSGDASPLKAPSGRTFGPPVDTTTGGAPAGRPEPSDDTGAKNAAKPAPALTRTTAPAAAADKTIGWLERLRRILVRLFS